MRERLSALLAPGMGLSGWPGLAAWASGGRLHLSLGRHGVSLDHRPHGFAAHTVPLHAQALPQGDADVAALIPALMTALDPALAGGRWAGAPLVVTVADEWVRLFLATPPANPSGMRDLRAVAALRFHTLYGDDPSAWRLALDPALDRPFLVCALPQALEGALRALAAAHRLRLVSVAPLFVRAWNALHTRLAGAAWLGVVRDDALTLGCVAPPPGGGKGGGKSGGKGYGRLVAVHRVDVPVGADGAWLRHQAHAAALRHGLDDPSALHLMGSPRPGWAGPAVGGAPSVAWVAPPAAFPWRFAASGRGGVA